jgi:hypothetical protein
MEQRVDGHRDPIKHPQLANEVVCLRVVAPDDQPY